MALGATILKADINISNMDRHYYAEHNLTIAQHPSETNTRMMLRLLCFALHADQDLSFTKGLSTDDEPDIWIKSLTNEINLWIDLGQPDEKRIRQACGKAKKVVIYNYGGFSDPWWTQNSAKLTRHSNLTVFHIDEEALKMLSTLSQRTMSLQFTIQDREIWVSNDEKNIHIIPNKRL